MGEEQRDDRKQGKDGEGGAEACDSSVAIGVERRVGSPRADAGFVESFLEVSVGDEGDSARKFVLGLGSHPGWDRRALLDVRQEGRG